MLVATFRVVSTSCLPWPTHGVTVAWDSSDAAGLNTNSNYSSTLYHNQFVGRHLINKNAGKSRGGNQLESSRTNTTTIVKRPQTRCCIGVESEPSSGDLTQGHKSINSLEHHLVDKKSNVMEITNEIIESVKETQNLLEKATGLTKDLCDKLKSADTKAVEGKGNVDLLKAQNRRLQDAVKEMDCKQQKFREEYEALQMILSNAEQSNQEGDKMSLDTRTVPAEETIQSYEKSKTTKKKPSNTTGKEVVGDATLPSVCPKNAINSLDAHVGEISACNFSSRGTYFATGGSDRLVKLWSVDTTTGNCSIVNTLIGSKGTIMSIEFDDQEKYTLATSNDQTALLWSVSAQNVMQTMTGHRDKVLCAKFLDAERVVTGSLDRTLKIWDLHHVDTSPKTLFAGSGCTDLIVGKSMRFSIISGHTDKKIRFWDIQSDKYSSIVLTGKVNSLDLSPDQTLLLCCTQDDILTLIDLRQNRIHTTLAPVGVSVGWCRARFSPDGQFVAAGSTLFVWETITGSQKCLKQQNIYPGVGCVWHPNGQLVAGVVQSKKIIFWK
ncbi:autophagy-related protein 16-1-like isoform X2 [Dysidea avara]|uniref:autophagy-related protein 16-1-like isoform X2 n=1 Tax=Dysidea avara TaxID=196820 RepID=UPI003317C82A